jgi:hypothetical protein
MPNYFISVFFAHHETPEFVLLRHRNSIVEQSLAHLLCSDSAEISMWSFCLFSVPTDIAQANFNVGMPFRSLRGLPKARGQ